ncbi:hypothetical protein H696_00566 [Fonticula alba]|uniref:Uncharacterized protein n=1 Tax=Fonticula alba TaxID=691883 RepID=A0A058ZGD9_FONAL|nr:hypothetical protein H696_00566 [Fonticula alba]KCV73016.1 hypothetical protein H696_00566 [Fonticula alba]|eukprot:XP_009492717.1 hypothetical protein H696_00566 [Fonticula alba]
MVSSLAEHEPPALGGLSVSASGQLAALHLVAGRPPGSPRIPTDVGLGDVVAGSSAAAIEASPRHNRTLLTPVFVDLAHSGNLGRRFPAAVLAPASATASDEAHPHRCLLEVSAHAPGRALRRELGPVFPDIFRPGASRFMAPDGTDLLRRDARAEFIVVPTFQRSAADLSVFSEHSELEKDRLLERFSLWAHTVCSRLNELGYWAAYADPASGSPVCFAPGAWAGLLPSATGATPVAGMPHSLSVTNPAVALYPEVAAARAFLRYYVDTAACSGTCALLWHPQWKSATYPATLFAFAPADVVRQIIVE